jgi:integrase
LTVARAKQQTTRYPGVYKRSIHDGRQTVYDIAYRDRKGKLVWIKGKFSNLQDANDERTRIVAENNAGSGVVDRRRTFADFAENTWLPRQEARVRQGKLERNSFLNLKRDLNGYLLEAFGDSRVHEITVEDVQSFADRLSKEGKSNWTVIRIVNALSSVLTLAKKNQLVVFNPVESVEKPQAKRQREPYPLTLAEVHQLADAAGSSDERNLILVAAFTGARMGELFGLRWENVNLEQEGKETALIVEQAYQGEVKDRPKTASGRRLIDLGSHAAEALRAQHVEGERPNPHGLVFPAPEGNHQRQSNFTRREWKNTRERAGLAQVVFHDLGTSSSRSSAARACRRPSASSSSATRTSGRTVATPTRFLAPSRRSVTP